MDERLRNLERRALNSGLRSDYEEFLINVIRTKSLDLSNMTDRQSLFELLNELKVRGVDFAYRDTVNLIHLIHLKYGMNNYPGIYLRGPGDIRLECWPDPETPLSNWGFAELVNPIAWVRTGNISFFDGSSYAGRVNFKVSYPNLGWNSLDERDLDYPDNGSITFYAASTIAMKKNVSFMEKHLIPLVNHVNSELAISISSEPQSGY